MILNAFHYRPRLHVRRSIYAAHLTDDKRNWNCTQALARWKFSFTVDIHISGPLPFTNSTYQTQAVIKRPDILTGEVFIHKIIGLHRAPFEPILSPAGVAFECRIQLQTYIGIIIIGLRLEVARQTLEYEFAAHARCAVALLCKGRRSTRVVRMSSTSHVSLVGNWTAQIWDRYTSKIVSHTTTLSHVVGA